MGCSTADLREKDVINICSGQNLGKVIELELDLECGKVCALVVSREGLASLLFCRNHLRVPWEKIVKIGKDTIIVDLPFEKGENKCACEADFSPKDPCGKDKCRKNRFF